jgi:hypothetical protein
MMISLLANVPAILFASIGILMAAIAFYFAMRNYARAARLTIAVIEDNVQKSIYFILPFEENTSCAIPFPLMLRNRGNKTAKNVNLIVDIPDALYRHDFKRSPDKISVARKVQMISDLQKNTQIARIFLTMPEIHRNVKSELLDFIFPETESILSMETDVTTKDAKEVKIAMKMSYSYDVRISIMAEDITPTVVDYKLEFRRDEGGGMSQAVNRENAFIKEIVGQNGQIDEDVVTFVMFKKFARNETRIPLVLEGDILSIARANFQRSTDGLIPL